MDEASKKQDDGVILLVTGSRSIKSFEVVAKVLDALPFRVKKLIHGGAVGVDQAAGRWAANHDIETQVYRPDTKTWPIAKYRWKAYTLRDYDMVRRADKVVGIWDGISGGTKKTVDYAKLHGNLHTTIKVDPKTGRFL